VGLITSFALAKLGIIVVKKVKGATYPYRGVGGVLISLP